LHPAKAPAIDRVNHCWRPLHDGWLLLLGAEAVAHRLRPDYLRVNRSRDAGGSKLTIAQKQPNVGGMRHLPKPRSRLFRSLSILALLAWTMFAFDAFAHPLAMSSGSVAAISTAMAKAASHCDGMLMLGSSQNLHHPTPSQPAGNGHGCCHNGGCYCASLCSGVASVPYLGVALQPVHDPALSLIRSEPVPVQSAPLLRPPIA